MKTIYLKDFKEAVKAEALRRNEGLTYSYTPGEIDAAIEAQVKKELRYNLTTGKTHDNYFGLSAEYVDPKEIPQYNTPEEAAAWEFTGYVRNSASRVKRGYAA